MLKRISDSLGSDYQVRLRQRFYNQYVEDEVTGKNVYPAIEITDASIVQLKDQIYQYPRSDYGRAQFYTPEKLMKGNKIDTVEFDISIIWLMNLILYVLLVFDAFNMAGVRYKYNF